MADSSPHSTVPWATDPSRPRAVMARDIRKSFGGVHALNGLDLIVEAESIHAIVGENGAGKSTLMNVLAGSIKPDSGELEIFGQPMHLGNLQESRNLGVGIMHQELRLFGTRSVLANLFAGHEPRKGILVNRKHMEAVARPIMERIGLDCDLSTQVSSLSLSDRQLVELGRVLTEQPRIIILDEPTSALNARESDRLLGVLRELADQGTTILYVSHRLTEVFAVADSISVIRDGRTVLTQPTSNLDIPEVVKAMVGEVLATQEPMQGDVDARSGAIDLEVRHLANDTRISDVSITVGSGEVVGIAGLVGSGAEEVLLSLFGAVPARCSEARFPDGRGLPKNPHEAACRGIAFVPADRKSVGVMLQKSIADNVAQVSIGAVGNGPAIISKKAVLAMANSAIRSLSIKAKDASAPVNELSGGNQQKVVLAKWLEIQPQILLLDDPTRGVDIGAKAEIFRIMRDLANQGKSVVFRSTEIAELVHICDRIYVVRDGETTHEVAEVSEEELLGIINGGNAAN